LANTSKSESSYTVYNFAIVKYASYYYLWSVQDGKFVAGDGTALTDTPTAITINELEELLIEREKTIIKDMVRIREEQGLSQAQLGRLCKVKQPVIARMEKSVHSPQLSSILKILEPMGYTLQIVPAPTEKN
jgi:predicted XRE-type DNA-binding protein